MTILLSDPRVAAVPVVESGEPLVPLPGHLGAPGVHVRAGVAARLVRAATGLPPGLRLRVVEGHRSVERQRAIIAAYSAEVRAARPRLLPREQDVLVSRFVAPVEVAPHVAGAAVDLTLVDARGDELDLGTRIDATPEQSAGRCYTASRDVSAAAASHRRLLVGALGGAGLVNYPTEWWHWSYGDRYWALAVGAPAAVYGPLDVPVAA